MGERGDAGGAAEGLGTHSGDDWGTGVMERSWGDWSLVQSTAGEPQWGGPGVDKNDNGDALHSEMWMVPVDLLLQPEEFV